MIIEGDIVSRLSYNNDVYFYVEALLPNNIIRLKGLNVRLLADAHIDDIKKAERKSFFGFKRLFENAADEMVREILEKRPKEEREVIAGRVLHVDADEGYLDICLSYYKKLGVLAEGINVAESSQPLAVKELLKKYVPDILVITGHDSIKEEEGKKIYSSSPYFAEAVYHARQVQPNRDSLVIFAGACQSDYESLIAAGANFASSPKRVMIHALDPVFISSTIAYTHFGKTINGDEIRKNTVADISAIAGIETHGLMRYGEMV